MPRKFLRFLKVIIELITSEMITFRKTKYDDDKILFTFSHVQCYEIRRLELLNVIIMCFNSANTANSCSKMFTLENSFSELSNKCYRKWDLLAGRFKVPL